MVIADAWRGPLQTTRLLEPPAGVNIALMDSSPLAAIFAKLFQSVLPAGFTPLFPWLALCYLAQPMAAVFALRGAGETRVLPNICVAIMALCCPTLLFRSRSLTSLSARATLPRPAHHIQKNPRPHAAAAPECSP